MPEELYQKMLEIITLGRFLLTGEDSISNKDFPLYISLRFDYTEDEWDKVAKEFIEWQHKNATKNGCESEKQLN